MDVEQEELKVLDVEDENLYELEIKNLDTNEVMKMKIPIEHHEHQANSDGGGSAKNSQKFESNRKDLNSIRFVRTFVKFFLTLGRCDWGERWESALLTEESGDLERQKKQSILQHLDSEALRQR